MRYPPRLAHLATTRVLAAKLVPGFAQAHGLDDEESRERLERGLQGALLEDLLAAMWRALEEKSKRFDADRTLEKIFETLKERPYRQGRKAEVTPSLAAFFVSVDIAAGTAGDSARRLMESDAGRTRAEAGLAEAGRLLATELTRGP